MNVRQAFPPQSSRNYFLNTALLSLSVLSLCHISHVPPRSSLLPGKMISAIGKCLHSQGHCAALWDNFCFTNLSFVNTTVAATPQSWKVNFLVPVDLYGVVVEVPVRFYARPAQTNVTDGLLKPIENR